MDFDKLVLKRESVREYIDKEIELELIKKCIEAGRLAPSACNSQPWKFVYVDNRNIANEITKNLGLNKNTNCKNYIVIVAEKRNIQSRLGEIIKKKDFTSMDIGIAAEHICLQAAELGLGTCLIGWFNEKKLKEILDIPKNKEVLLVISIGYYDNKEPRKKKRKEGREILSLNRY